MTNALKNIHNTILQNNIQEKKRNNNKRFDNAD